MTTKTEIFRDIVTTMTNDYAGYIEKKPLNNPDNYVITDDMDDLTFIKTVQSYLLDFKDGHLLFYSNNTALPFRGFRVRRYKNALYVTELLGEERLCIGDKIIGLDGLSIEQYEKENYKILEDKEPERQYWNEALKIVDSIKIEKDNEIVELSLLQYEGPGYTPEYSGKRLDPHTFYIKLTDFNQSEPIQKIVDDNREVFEEVQNLIIDVRTNYGGSDLFYYPLLDYIFEVPTPLNELFEEDEVMYTNYTKNNCDLRIATLKQFLDQPLNAETKASLEKEIEKYTSNSGKGLQVINEKSTHIINGRENPRNVYILSDFMCGSSGDTFVKNVKKSPKVTVVGRGTMGIVDYCNVTMKTYGDYVFGYSVSKIDEKYHCNETGVLPDIHIPWTPEHLKKDMDLNYVLKLCNAN